MRIGKTEKFAVIRGCFFKHPHRQLHSDNENPRINNTFLICGKPAEIRRAAPKAHLREICGHLRPEHYVRAHKAAPQLQLRPRKSTIGFITQSLIFCRFDSLPGKKSARPSSTSPSLSKKARILRYFSQLHRKSLKPVQMFISLQTIYNSGEKR